MCVCFRERVCDRGDSPGTPPAIGGELPDSVVGGGGSAGGVSGNAPGGCLPGEPGMEPRARAL